MNIDTNLITFPFKDERWQNKLLIGGLLGFAGALIWPLMLPLWGYGLDVMRRAQISGEPSLPEWDDWGRLFADGLRLLVVFLIYTLPVWLLYCVGIGVVIAGFPMFAAAEEAPALGWLGMLAMSGGMTVFGLAMFPALGLGYLASVATTRMVADERLGAAFDFREVWALARSGFKHFGLAFAVLLGIYMALSFVITALSYTICLACLTPFVTGAVMGYTIVLYGALMGLAYRATNIEIEPPAEPAAAV